MMAIGGACSTLSSEPSRLLYDREGSFSGSADSYSAAPSAAVAWHIDVSPFTVDVKAPPSSTRSPISAAKTTRPGST